MGRRPKKPQNMRTKDKTKQKVTISRLPLVKCLTAHYRDNHV